MTDATLDAMAHRHAGTGTLAVGRSPDSGSGSGSEFGGDHDNRIGAEMTPRPLFDDVLDRHSSEIYRYACHLTRNCVDADDLYQETMLKAYRAFGRLDAEANFRAWLYRIATNTFLSDRRKLGREHPLDEITEATLPAASTDQAAGLDARDLLREVEVFLAALPRKQRVALVLRKYHEADYAQIAESLGCSEPAARANVHEALRKLRTSFGDRL